MDPDSRRLRVSVTDGRGRRVRAAGLAAWLARVAPARARGELTLALVTDREIQRLNRRFRRKDAATDVLSFASTPNPEPRTPDPRKYLGDIAIATGVARRQARDAGHPYWTELRVLALHGLLHLLGYDHHRAENGGRMARAEARLRRKGGLRSGLIERACGRPAGARSVRLPSSRRAVRRTAVASAKAG